MILFTYGTLRPSLYPQNAGRFGLTKLRDAQMTVGLQMKDLGSFPALVVSPDHHTIHGELAECSDSMLPRLDAYEGYSKSGDGLYDRTEIEVDGTTAFVYFMHAQSEGDVVESGDWKNAKGCGRWGS